jgi:hypothetical protein
LLGPQLLKLTALELLFLLRRYDSDRLWGRSLGSPQASRPTRRTRVRLMARPPQFERSHATVVKESLKRLDPTDRARLLAWLLLYFNDDGMLFSPQTIRRRQRITLDDVEYWLVRVPKRR